MALFVEVDDCYVNLDLVTTFKLNGAAWRFNFADGETLTLDAGHTFASDLLDAGKKIIPAPPGWRALVGNTPNGGEEFPFEDPQFEDIIAFAVGHDDSFVDPITVESGDLLNNDNHFPFAVVAPDGRVLELGCASFGNVDAFLAAKRKEHGELLVELKKRAKRKAVVAALEKKHAALPKLDGLKQAIKDAVLSEKENDPASRPVFDLVAGFKKTSGLKYVLNAQEEHRPALFELARQAGLSIASGGAMVTATDTLSSTPKERQQCDDPSTAS